MRILILLLLVHISCTSFSQSINEKLSLAVKNLEDDPQCKHGIVSLYVVDGKTGNMVYERNSEIGLAPASCQKIIASITSFDLLGKDYRYKTSISIDGVITGGVLNGNLYIIGSGDPTMGSWRYAQTKNDAQLKRIADMLKSQGISQVNGNIIVLSDGWETQATPGGWPWDDVGNYYGAGPWVINWNENQYDLVIIPGKRKGDPAKIVRTIPNLTNVKLINELITGAENSGDNTIIFLPERGSTGFVRGTVPAGENEFRASGSIPDPPMQFLYLLKEYLLQNKIGCKCKLINTQDSAVNTTRVMNNLTTVGELISPPLDSINYWFLKKSVNLYGEALVKTISYEKNKFASTQDGLDIIKDYWSKKGVEKTAMRILDGSGLSPANRVTTNTLVTIFQYAKKQSWYSSFYNALPEINDLKMKSGSIGGVLSYTGYVKSKQGNEYTFSFIINNFNGSGITLKTKMWKLLDILK